MNIRSDCFLEYVYHVMIVHIVNGVFVCEKNRATFIDLFAINFIKFFFVLFLTYDFFLLLLLLLLLLLMQSVCKIVFVSSVPLLPYHFFHGFAYIWFLCWIYANHRKQVWAGKKYEMPTLANGNRGKWLIDVAKCVIWCGYHHRRRNVSLFNKAKKK